MAENSMETIVRTACCHGCGGRCVLRVHVKDGRIIRMETDDEEPQYRACARGRAYRQRLYSPDRLQFPMKRAGERGEGKFERISWDEALDSVANEIKRVRDTYGPASILYTALGSASGEVHSWRLVLWLLSMAGGCTFVWGGPSAEGSIFSARATYGTGATGHERVDMVNSRLIIMWGWDPAATIQITRTSYYLAKAKEAGAKVISVDPRYSDSAATFADEWVPIRPGTDSAALVAMAYVMMVNNLYDQKFIDAYSLGFDKFKDYVLGKEDGIPKTPQWQESITGIPAALLEKLARDYATIKPAALITGYAPGRTAYGEQFHRAASTLAAMTGNVGKHGGGAAGFERGILANQGEAIRWRDWGNPVDAGSHLKGTLDSKARSRTRVHFGEMWDAILEGKAGGYPADIKMLYVTNGNPLDQYLNTNKGVQALKQLESIIIHEQFMTPTARFADILLPVTTHLERNDIVRPWLSGPLFFYTNKAIEPLHECKDDFDICSELAPRLGIKRFSDLNEEEWLREAVKKAPDLAKFIPDFDKFREKGVYKIPQPERAIAFKKQVEDPKHNPFPTPSGKIEIYSKRIADLHNPKLPPVPTYIEAWEGTKDPLAKKYPLQLVTNHPKMGTHGCHERVPWLQETERRMVWINSADASLRGIKNGERVRVFNDRGALTILAKVTERIMPGVVSIEEGGWYDPDENGVDRGGCVNVLTRNGSSPGGAFPSNSCLVQISKN